MLVAALCGKPFPYFKNDAADICFSKRRSRRKSSSHCTSGMMDREKSSNVASLNWAAANAASVGVSTKARLPKSL